LRLQCVLQGSCGEDLVAGQPAHTSGARANGLLLNGRDAAPVAADGASLAAVVAAVAELSGRSKVQGGEGG